MTTAVTTSFDALIVGAGPAGTYLAYLLAKQGASVGIIEKSRVPRDKVCGGGVSRKAINLLDFDITPIVHQWIQGAHLSYRHRTSIFKNIDPPAGCTVLRREFDFFLLQQACAAGAQFFPETAFVDVLAEHEHIVVHTSQRQFHCRLLLGADGVGSGVRKKVFGKQFVCYVPALEAMVPIDDSSGRYFERSALFEFGAMPRGYGWIFPKRDHLNVGVYSPYGGGKLREHLAALIARQIGLHETADIKYTGYPIPLSNTRNIFQGDRVWLLGDAAGFADGVFGEGIYFALKSAALAAQALQETGFAPNSSRYTTLVKQTLLPELRASQWMGKALFSFPEFSFSHLVCNPRINAYFAGLISGEVGYRECLVKTVVTAARVGCCRPRRAAAVSALMHGEATGRRLS